MTKALFVDPETLQKLIDLPGRPLLIDFMAQWCGPCQGMAPYLEDFATSSAQSLSVAKLDIDAFPEVATRFMVRSVPTLMLLLDGQVLGVHVGAMNKTQLGSFVATGMQSLRDR